MRSIRKYFSLIFLSLIYLLTYKPIRAQGIKQHDVKVEQLGQLLERSLQLSNRLKLDSAIFYADATIKLADLIHQPYYAISAILIKAKCYGFRENFESAFKQLDFAEERIRKVKANDLWVKFYAQKAKIFSIKQDQKMAIHYYHLAFNWIKKTNDKVETCRLLYQLSLSYSYDFELDSSQFYLVQALPIAEQINDSSKVFEILKLMLFNYGNLNEMKLAYESGLRANAFIDHGSNKLMKSTFYLDMATISVKSSHLDTAKYFAENYYNSIRETKDGWSIRNGKALKAGIFFAELKFDSAEFYFKQSLIDTTNNKIHFKTEDYDNKFLDYAICLIQNKKNEEAISFLKVNIDETANLKRSLNVVAVYYYLATAYINLGNADSANYYLIKYQNTKDSVFTIARTNVIYDLNKKYETDKKERTIKELKLSSQLSALQLVLRNDQLEQEMLLNNNQRNELLLSSKENDLSKAENNIQKINLQHKEEQLAFEKNKSLLKSLELNTEKNKRQLALLFSFATILLGFYIYWLYQKRKKLSNQLATSLTELKQTQSQLIHLEKEKEAEAIRLRISRDIHDEIGSNLTKIAMLGNLTSMQAKDKMPEVANQLASITKYAHQVNESMSEIIWAVNPKQDTLENLLAFMRTHTEEFLKDTGINYQINFPKSVPTIQLHPELKRSLFLVLKESLNNALKHASAKNIAVAFSLHNKNFEMNINDDGVGFLSSPLTPLQRRGEGGNGLSNMQSRIQALNLNFEIISSPGNGCQVVVSGII